MNKRNHLETAEDLLERPERWIPDPRTIEDRLDIIEKALYHIVCAMQEGD